MGEHWLQGFGGFQKWLYRKHDVAPLCINPCLLFVWGIIFCLFLLVRKTMWNTLCRQISLQPTQQSRKRNSERHLLTVFTQMHGQVGGWLSDGMCHGVRVIPVLLLLLMLMMIVVVGRGEIVNLWQFHQKGAWHFYFPLMKKWSKPPRIKRKHAVEQEK